MQLDESQQGQPACKWNQSQQSAMGDFSKRSAVKQNSTIINMVNKNLLQRNRSSASNLAILVPDEFLLISLLQVFTNHKFTVIDVSIFVSHAM